MIQVDNTLLCDMEKCNARGIARHVLGLRSTESKLKADIGNVFHAALEAYFKGVEKAGVMEVFDAAYDKVVPFGEQPEEASLGRENCRRIMGRYCDVRPLEKFPFEAVEFEQVVGAELAPGIMFYAKRDLRVRDRKSGLMIPCDHKTRHGVISDWWASKYRMLSQMTGYCWLEGKLSGGPCLECYVNAIEVQKIPDSSRKCPTHKVPYAECGPEHIKFLLLTYSRTPEMIEAWQRDAIAAAKKFGMLREAFPTVDYLPFARRNGAFNESCTFCEFKKWCAAGFRREMMTGLVVEDRWAPWEGTGARTAS